MRTDWAVGKGSGVRLGGTILMKSLGHQRWEGEEGGTGLPLFYLPGSCNTRRGQSRRLSFVPWACLLGMGKPCDLIHPGRL